MTSIVRGNALACGNIYRMLDLGAQGICVPHIDTADSRPSSLFRGTGCDEPAPGLPLPHPALVEAGAFPALEAALAAMGVPCGACRPPARALDAAATARLRERLAPLL